MILIKLCIQLKFVTKHFYTHHQKKKNLGYINIVIPFVAHRYSAQTHMKGPTGKVLGE